MALVAFTAIVVIECVRGLFSLTYKVGESIGFLVAGLIVVGLFASPVLAPLLRRIVPPRALVLVAVGVLAAGRLAWQVVTWPTFAPTAVLLGLGLVTLTLVMAALRAHRHDGSLLTAIAVTFGAGVDTAMRATGITWDLIWRDDIVAWVLTLALVAGLAAVALLSVRAGVVPSGEALTLQRLEGNQQRSAVFLTVDPGDGKPIHIIGTHLENGDPQQFKDARAQAYRDIIAKWNGEPRTIFLGDFNTYPRTVPPGWPELNIPLDAGFHTPQDIDHCTVPTSNANCPDWIMASPDAALSPVTIVVDRPDHRPITALVTFPS